MLAEGDIFTSEILIEMFKLWGIEGFWFYEGEEAIDWIDDVDAKRFQGELPELAIIDLRLSGEINGVKVSERLRESLVLGNIPIVLTTSYRLTPDEQDQIIQQADADMFLPKPFPVFKELKFILEKVIAERDPS